MNGGKSPGNDGLTVEFYKQFWKDIKNVILNQSLIRFQSASYQPLRNKPLSSFQKSANKDKRFVGNWRPISLLNVDTKIFSKTVASHFIPILPTIISSDQTAYVKGRFIGESIRLYIGILQTRKYRSLPYYC